MHDAPGIVDPECLLAMRFRKPMICSSLYLLFFMSIILHGLMDFSTLDRHDWRGQVSWHRNVYQNEKRCPLQLGNVQIRSELL